MKDCLNMKKSYDDHLGMYIGEDDMFDFHDIDYTSDSSQDEAFLENFAEKYPKEFKKFKKIKEKDEDEATEMVGRAASNAISEGNRSGTNGLIWKTWVNDVDELLPLLPVEIKVDPKNKYMFKMIINKKTLMTIESSVNSAISHFDAEVDESASDFWGAMTVIAQMWWDSIYSDRHGWHNKKDFSDYDDEAAQEEFNHRMNDELDNYDD
jgi:hypothetical protein